MRLYPAFAAEQSSLALLPARSAIFAVRNLTHLPKIGLTKISGHTLMDTILRMTMNPSTTRITEPMGRHIMEGRHATGFV